MRQRIASISLVLIFSGWLTALALIALSGLLAPVQAGTSGGSRAQHPQGYIAGCVLSVSGDAALTITAGRFRDQANTRDVEVAAITLASTFQAFSFATGGGIDTGAEAGSTWYAVHVVERGSDGQDAALISLSASAPTAQTGQSSRRLIGWLRNDGSSNLLQGAQLDDGTTRTWLYAREDMPLTAPFNVLSAGGSTTNALIDCSGVVPATQSDVVIVSLLRATATSFSRFLNGGDLGSQQAAIQGGYDTEAGTRGNGAHLMFVDANEDIGYRVDGGTAAYVDVVGWVGVFNGSE